MTLICIRRVMDYYAAPAQYKQKKPRERGFFHFCTL